MRIVVVLGMHRSGTSAMAGCLAELGCHLGETIDAASENAKGFFENRALVDLDERLLRDARSTWDDIRLFPPGWAQPLASSHCDRVGRLLESMPAQGVVALKDPRLCRLLPVWLPVLDAHEVLYVHALRHPVQVAASLQRRNGFTPLKSAWLWLLHVLEAEHHTRGRERVFLRMNELVDDPTATLEAVAASAPFALPVAPAARRDALRSFVGAARPAVSGIDFGPLGELINDVWEHIDSQDHLDAAYDQLSRTHTQRDPALLAHIDDLTSRQNQSRDSVDELLGSKTWRLMAPVRKMLDRLSGRAGGR